METANWPRPFFERIRPSFMESWPQELVALAIPHTGLVLSPDEAKDLDAAAPLWRDRLLPSDPAGLRSLAGRLQPALAAHPNGVFVRLGSASPKDSALFRANQGRSTLPSTALKLLQTSPRIRAHLRRCLELGHPPSVFVMPWLPIQPWQEFRCFLRERRWVGVSQLDCVNHGALPELPQAGPRIGQALRALLPHLAAASHLDSGVFDVCVLGDRHAPAGCRAWLVELNPWGPVTDACLFRWDRPRDFDGSFRYLEGPGTPRVRALRGLLPSA